ncbi:hypothetical protein FQZ97_853080 [compost metagenome]
MAQPRQGLVGTAVLLANAVDLSGLHSSGDIAVQFAGDTYELLDLLDTGHALALAPPQVVFDAATHVQAHGDGHGVQRQHIAHDALDGQHRVVGTAVDELHHVARVGAVGAAADADPVEHERAGIDATADDTLHGLQLSDITQHEVRLDTRSLQSPEVFGHEGRTRGNGHLRIGLLVSR